MESKTQQTENLAVLPCAEEPHTCPYRPELKLTRSDWISIFAIVVPIITGAVVAVSVMRADISSIKSTQEGQSKFLLSVHQDVREVRSLVETRILQDERKQARANP